MNGFTVEKPVCWKDLDPGQRGAERKSGFIARYKARILGFDLIILSNGHQFQEPT